MASDVKIRILAEDKAKRELKSVDKGLRSLATVAASVTGAIYTMKKAFDFAEQGAQIERLEESGQRLASQFDQNMGDITDSIVRASGNTIDRMTAMQAANNAMVLDVAKSPEEFEKLTKAAVALGRATGRDAAQSIQDLTTGVGRQSRMILDNLGIIVEAEKDYGNYAKELGKTAGELTDAEKKQALLNKAIEAAQPLLDEQGNLIGDSASEFERAKAEWKDFTAELKKGTLKAVLPVVSHMNDAADAQDRLNEAVEKGTITEEELSDLYYKGTVTLMDREEALAFLTEREKELAAASENTGRVLDLERQAQYNLNQESQEFIITQGVMTEEAKEWAAAQLEAKNNTKGLLDEINRDVASPIESFIKDLEWFIATGGRIEEAFSEVQELVESGAITPELGVTMAQELLTGAIDVQEEMGTMGIDEAAQSLADNFNIELEEAKEIISGTDGIEPALQRVDQIAMEAEGIRSFKEDILASGAELRAISSRPFVVDVILNVEQRGSTRVTSGQVDQITEEMMMRMRGIQ